MAKREGGRANNRTSFGKRQRADDDFRKKKRDTGKNSRGEEREGPRGGSSERKGFKGSSYSAGKRNFSGGGDEKRPFRSGKPASRPYGEKRSFGDRDESRPRRSFGDRDESRPRRSSSFGERKSYGDRNESRPRRSGSFGEKKSYGDRDESRPRRSSSFGDKKSYGDRNESRPRRSFGEKKSFGDRDESRPRRSYGDRDESRPRRESKFSRDGERPRREDRGEREERRSFVESKIQKHRERVERPEKQEKNAPAPFQDPDALIRLNKFISNSGVCSRREADELIKMGVITVNGTTVTEMGFKVKPTDDIRHDGKKLTAERPVYILLNKPKGFITTTEDPQERNTVMELIAGACKERVYPVGRLDRNTTGLLLLTNDGELTEKLTHPSFNAKKIYKVELDKPITKADFQKIVEGVHLEEGKAMVDDLAIVSDDNKTVGIELHIGWNHVVRRIFNALEYDVVKLDRVVYAGLDKKDLKRGQWRFLKSEEIVRLKHFK